MTVNLYDIQPHPRTMPNGVVLILGVNYRSTSPEGDPRGRTPPKTFTYAALKAGNLWYLTGTGKVPQAATWLAVERWLGRDDRDLAFVEIMGHPRRIYPAPVEEAKTSMCEPW